MLETEDGRFLPESGAILWYLADGALFLPDDPWEHAQVLRWMFFEQYSHEPFVAVARFWLKHLPADDPRRAQLPDKQKGGTAALEVMEGHRKDHGTFVGARLTIADIALYADTHVADEGGFDLSRYPRDRSLVRARGGPARLRRDYGGLRDPSPLSCHHRA